MGKGKGINHERILKLVLVFLVFCAVFSAGCIEEKTREAKNVSVKVTDMAGKNLTLDHIPKRAVFLAGESWIYALGIKDRVVGVSRWAYGNPIILKVDPDIREIPSPGDMMSVNEEELLKLNPDVIVVWDEPPGYAKTTERLEKLGIPVIRIGHIEKYPDDICREAMLLGKVFGVEDRAEKICSYIESKWNEITSKTPEKPVKVIYSFIRPTYIACKDVSYAKFIEAVGGQVATQKSCKRAWTEVNKEWIIQQNPEIWIISYYAKYNESAILNDPGFRDVTAVKNKAVYKESYKPLQFLEPYFILTVMEYANWIHPEVYNFNMSEEEKELLKEVYGVG